MARPVKDVGSLEDSQKKDNKT